MIKLIVGPKGSGKTKAMIDMINGAISTTAGNVVVIEKAMKLTYDIDHKARLIDMDEYAIDGAGNMYGFVAGILAGNYDITELFIDGVLKVLDKNLAELEIMLKKIDKIAGDNLKITVTVSCAEEDLPVSLKEYL